MALDSQKLLPQGNKGGALAVSRPKVSLVKKEVKKDIISAPNAPDNMLVIKTRVIEIEKILKGSVALDKKLQDEERKKREKESRAEEEKELETKDEDDADKKVKKKKSKVKLGFLDGLIKFINDVLMGWLLVRMVDFLPQLQKILPLLGGALDFLTSTVLGIVNALGTFLMWGDKAIGGSRKFVENIFGEKGAKVFDAIVGTIGNLFNVISILGMTAAAFGNEWDRQSNKNKNKNKKKPSKPKRKPKSLGDRARRMRRSIQSRLGRASRRVGDTFNRLKPSNLKKTGSNLLKRAGNIKNRLMQRGGNLLQKVKPSNLKQTGSNLLKRAGNIKNRLMQRGSNVLKRFKPSNLKQAGSNLFQRVKGSKFVQGAIQKGKGALSWADDFAKKQMANVDNIIGGIKARGAEWAKKIGKNLKNMNPMKLGEKVKGLLKGKMNKIVNNNDLIKQIKNLNVKDAAKNIKKILEGAKKNKNILKLRQGLKAAKAAKIGGVDAVIAAIMGVLDYAVFKESPINAILRAIGGLLGYTAGFAIGAPFGGAPGFITGMAGAFVGEFASKMIAKGLAKTELGKIPDPIMNDGRMLVRDPDDTAMNEELEKEQLEHGLGEDKISKELKIGKKTFDLSESMGGLSREEYDALSNKDRGILNRRMRMYASQNEGVAKIMPVDVNSVAKNTEAISKSASYEEGGEGGTVVIVENSSGGGDQQTESGSNVVVGGGSDDSTTDAFYKGG